MKLVREAMDGLRPERELAYTTVMTVLDLLIAVDAQTVGGVIAGGNTARRTKVNNVFGAINDAGRI